MICDAHCHVDLMNNMMEVISEMQNSGIYLFAVGTTPKAYSREKKFCQNSSHIKVGLGMHPQLVSTGHDDLKLFKDFIAECHYIGEIGLDFSKEYIQTKEKQINIFNEIVAICERYGEKVISVHSRRSTSTVIDILMHHKMQKNNKYILHWFTGSIPQLEKAIEIGCYFSINPNMLKTKSGIEIIKRIPTDRMLLETDAPFAFNASHVSDIENELRRTMSEVSNIINVDMETIILENSKNVFRY